MANDRGSAAWPYLRAAYDGGASAGLTDGQLLERFTLRGGEASALAFAALVERHGPLVLRACRASLGDEHDAEDAFQAVFLVLARKARSLRVVDTIAPWLLDVARRTSAEARSIRARRRSREVSGVDLPEPASPSTDPDDPSPLIHEELSRLPDRYRAPLLLCDLEGLTHEEAARRLGWPVGTLKSRQSRGRSRLRARLIRRGLAPSAMATLATVGRASATVPASLAASTISAALGGASPAAVALMEGVVATMWLKRFLVIASTTIALGLTAGMSLARYALVTREDPPKATAPAPRPATARPIREILREASRSVRSDATADYRAYALSEVAKAQARAGDTDEAKATAREAAATAGLLPAGQAANALLAAAWACGASGERSAGSRALEMASRLAAGMEIAGGIEQVGAGLQARQFLLLAQLDLGDREAAAANVRAMTVAVEALKDDKTHLYAARTLVQAQTLLGDSDGAIRTALAVGEAMAEDKHYAQGILLAQIAETLSSASHWVMQPRRDLTPHERKARLRILNQVEKEVESFEFAEEKHSGDLARVYAYLGDFDSALRLARRIGKEPINQPHLIDRAGEIQCYVFSVVGGLLGEAGHREEARSLLRDAVALCEGDPELAMWRSGQVAVGQARAGDFSGALKTSEAVHLRSRVNILPEIATLQKKAGDREGARATLRLALGVAEDLLNNAADPDRDKDNCRYRIAEIQALSGDHGTAVATMNVISSEHEKSRAALVIARARAADGDAEGTLTWALSLALPTVRSAAMRGLAEGVVTPPNQASARPIREVLREAAKAIRSCGDAGACASSLIAIANAQNRVGDRVGATENAEFASDKAVLLMPDAASQLLTALAWIMNEAGDRQGGLKNLERSSIKAQKIENLYDRCEALGRVAYAQADLGDRKAAEQSIGTLSQILAMNPDGALATTLIRAQVATGDIDGAFNSLKTYGGVDDHLKGIFLNIIAETVATPRVSYYQTRKTASPERRKAVRPNLERVTKAVEAYEFIDNQRIADLAVGWAFIHEFDEAMRIARRLPEKPIGGNMGDVSRRLPWALSHIGAYQGKAGRTEESRRTFREAIDLVDRDPDLASLRVTIGDCQSDAGEFVAARRTAEAVDPRMRPHLLVRIARAQIKAGDREGGRVTLREAFQAEEFLIKTPEADLPKWPETPPVPPEGTENPERARKNVLQAQLAEIQSLLRDVGAADAALAKIDMDAWKQIASGWVARARTEVGEAEGALAWALTLKPEAARCRALQGLGEAFDDR